ncbi:hypothetical protein HDV01_007564 [Terramyces sp. JEL0728]|nr:hypothetical protein HDV01_007564 [Terramyces sp. JEL0728]
MGDFNESVAHKESIPDAKEDLKSDKTLHKEVMKLYLKANHEIIKVKYNVKKHGIDKILHKLWSKEEESKKKEYIIMAKEIMANGVNKKDAVEKRKAEAPVTNAAKKFATSANVAFQFGPSSQITSTPMYTPHLNTLPLSPVTLVVSPVLSSISPIQTPMLSPQLNNLASSQPYGQSLFQNDSSTAPIQKAKVQTSRVYLEQQLDGTFVMMQPEGQTTSNTTFTRQPDGSYLMVSTEIEASDSLIAPIASPVASPKILSPVLPAANYVSPQAGNIMVSPGIGPSDFAQDLPSQIVSPQRILSPLLSPQLNAKHTLMAPTANNVISPLLSPQLQNYSQNNVLSPLLSPQLKTMNSQAILGSNLNNVNSFLENGPVDFNLESSNSFLLPIVADQDLHPSFNAHKELAALFADNIPYNSPGANTTGIHVHNSSNVQSQTYQSHMDHSRQPSNQSEQNTFQSLMGSDAHARDKDEFFQMDPAFSFAAPTHNYTSPFSSSNLRSGFGLSIGSTEQNSVQNSMFQDSLQSPLASNTKTIDQHISEQWSTLDF